MQLRFAGQSLSLASTRAPPIHAKTSWRVWSGNEAGPDFKNSTTGADASGKYQLAGIHKFINALTTHSAECSRMQLCKHRSQAGVNQLGVTTILAREWDSCHSFLAQFLRSRRAICSTDRTYKLPGSHVWAVLYSEKCRSPATAIKVSKSRHNSRTNLRTKVLWMQIRANIDISLYCLFQRLVFSERREMLVTDRRTDGRTDGRTNSHDYSTVNCMSVEKLRTLHIAWLHRKVMVEDFRTQYAFFNGHAIDCTDFTVLRTAWNFPWSRREQH